jgi:flagellar hook-length control protein FliK
MSGAITKLSIDVLAPPTRASFPGSAPHNNAYAQVAQSVDKEAATGSSVPTTNKTVEQGQSSATSAFSSASTEGKSSSKAIATADGAAAKDQAGKRVEDAQSGQAALDDTDQDAAEAVGLDKIPEAIPALQTIEADTLSAVNNELNAEDKTAEAGLLLAADSVSGVADAEGLVGPSAATASVLTDIEGSSAPVAEQPARAAEVEGAERAIASADTAKEIDERMTDRRAEDTREMMADPAISDPRLAAAVPRGDTVSVPQSKLMTGTNGMSGAVDVLRAPTKSAEDDAEVNADLRRNTTVETGVRGVIEGKVANADGTFISKLLSAELQGAAGRPTTSSIDDASPLTPLVQTASPAAVKPAGALVELALPTRLGEAGWQEGLAGRVSMMVNQRIGVATIRMNPPELGPIEVKVNLNHDQASVQFVSQAVQVREALEQSIPRLREMLEESGFTLVDAQVSDQSQQQPQQDRQQAGGRGESAVDVSALAAQIPARQSVGLIDYYA